MDIFGFFCNWGEIYFFNMCHYSNSVSSLSQHLDSLTEIITITMKKSTTHSALRILAIVLGISVASQASARHFRVSGASEYRIVNINYTPATDNSVFAIFNTAGSGFSGTLRTPLLPKMTTVLRSALSHNLGSQFALDCPDLQGP